MTFPPLPTDWEPTRSALHAAAAAVGAVARSAATPHPRWWHVSLGVTPTGLVTDPMPGRDGATVTLVLDPPALAVRVVVDGAVTATVPIAGGATGAGVGDRIFEAASSAGIIGDFDRSRLHADDPGEADPEAARDFWDALVEVAAALEHERASRPGETGPVQLWPHGFDIAFEWYGSRRVTGEDGEDQPAQLNLGWYPGGDAYFYSNPWPFDPGLVDHPLPPPASWHTDGWQGTILPYSDVAGDPVGRERFSAYATTVFDLARPTLQ